VATEIHSLGWPQSRKASGLRVVLSAAYQNATLPGRDTTRGTGDSGYLFWEGRKVIATFVESVRNRYSNSFPRHGHIRNRSIVARILANAMP
jgi:hypothetical protein